MLHPFNKLILLTASSLTVISCAIVDPHGVGIGQYLQGKNANGIVVYENDQAKSGYLNCPNMANLEVNMNPKLKGFVNCSISPTNASLPFAIRVHSENSPALNMTYNTKPFSLKFAAKAECQAQLAGYKKDPKWIILEENCSGA